MTHEPHNARVWATTGAVVTLLLILVLFSDPSLTGQVPFSVQLVISPVSIGFDMYSQDSPASPDESSVSLSAPMTYFFPVTHYLTYPIPEAFSNATFSIEEDGAPIPTNTTPKLQWIGTNGTSPILRMVVPPPEITLSPVDGGDRYRQDMTLSSATPLRNASFSFEIATGYKDHALYEQFPNGSSIDRTLTYDLTIDRKIASFTNVYFTPATRSRELYFTMSRTPLPPARGGGGAAASNQDAENTSEPVPPPEEVVPIPEFSLFLEGDILVVEGTAEAPLDATITLFLRDDRGNVLVLEEQRYTPFYSVGLLLPSQDSATYEACVVVKASGIDPVEKCEVFSITGVSAEMLVPETQTPAPFPGPSAALALYILAGVFVLIGGSVVLAPKIRARSLTPSQKLARRRASKHAKRKKKHSGKRRTIALLTVLIVCVLFLSLNGPVTGSAVATSLSDGSWMAFLVVGMVSLLALLSFSLRRH